MAQRDNILQELQTLESRLTTVSPLNVYNAPSGYFETLADQVLSRIKAMDTEEVREELRLLSPVLSQVPVSHPYAVPAGYFDQLQENLPGLITSRQTAIEELQELSPLLSRLDKKNPYQVPGNYFEKISVPASTVKQETKVVSFSSRKWFRYAAAAIVVGVVATTGLLFLNKKDGTITNEKSFSWIEKNMKKVSTDEIDKFVELTDNTAPIIASANEKDVIKEMIKNIPEEEILDFLNDTKAAESEDTDEMIFN